MPGLCAKRQYCGERIRVNRQLLALRLAGKGLPLLLASIQLGVLPEVRNPPRFYNA
jgi:hypothetical protein